MHRRGFLISGMAAAGSATPVAASAPTRAAVYEASVPAGSAFAAAARKAGARTWAIHADITDVWFHQLHPLWARTPAPLAGLTFYPALFCIERLAWDHGMRLVTFTAHASPHRLDAEAVAATLFGHRNRRPVGLSSPPPNSTDLVSWLIAPRN